MTDKQITKSGIITIGIFLVGFAILMCIQPAMAFSISDMPSVHIISSSSGITNFWINESTVYFNDSNYLEGHPASYFYQASNPLGFISNFSESDPVFSSWLSSFLYNYNQTASAIQWVQAQNYLDSFTETDPIFTAQNSTMWASINNKRNATYELTSADVSANESAWLNNCYNGSYLTSSANASYVLLTSPAQQINGDLNVTGKIILGNSTSTTGEMLVAGSSNFTFTNAGKNSITVIGPSGTTVINPENAIGEVRLGSVWGSAIGVSSNFNDLYFWTGGGAADTNKSMHFKTYQVDPMDRLLIDGNTGYIAINNETPAHQLEVTGDIYSSDNITTNNWLFGKLNWSWIQDIPDYIKDWSSNAVTIAGENITSGTIAFARLPSLTNTHTLDANNITNPFWVNKTGDTMTGTLQLNSNLLIYNFTKPTDDYPQIALKGNRTNTYISNSLNFGDNNRSTRYTFYLTGNLSDNKGDFFEAYEGYNAEHALLYAHPTNNLDSDTYALRFHDSDIVIDDTGNVSMTHTLSTGEPITEAGISLKTRYGTVNAVNITSGIIPADINITNNAWGTCTWRTVTSSAFTGAGAKCNGGEYMSGINGTYSGGATNVTKLYCCQI